MLSSVSIIVPTYQEAASLPHLIKSLAAVKKQYSLSLELLIMDDDSQDGTEKLIHSMDLPWIRLITRCKERGLSPAVVEGFGLAQFDAIVVMDADLSHPPEMIPQMLNALNKDYSIVIGSRYVSGGTTDLQWTFFRHLNSKIACWLASPLTSVKDPMSGFFAFKRSLLEKVECLNPIGYKICLELLIKSYSPKILEIPIHFKDREHGKSKLSIWEQFKFIQHLHRLYLYRYPDLAHLFQFLVIHMKPQIKRFGTIKK